MGKTTLALNIAISTHTPHAGRDQAQRRLRFCHLLFQLTRPTRGVTNDTRRDNADVAFQLTRPTRGVTAHYAASFRRLKFQLTRPTRGVTRQHFA